MLVRIKKEYILYIILVGLIIIFGLYYSLNIDINVDKYTNKRTTNDTTTIKNLTKNTQINQENSNEYIKVHVSGAVKNPDKLYTLKKKSRVNDAIKLAGGVTEEANLELINLARFINDGDKIYIPKKSDKINGINNFLDNNLEDTKK